MKQFEQIINEIQAQYRDTNIADLIKGIIEIKRKYILMAIYSLVNDNLSISSAKGIGLDLWGNLLHLSRFIPSDGGANYTYFNFNDKNFKTNGGLIFYNANRPSYGELDDFYYRQLLLIIYQSYFLNSSIPTLNLFTLESFADYGYVYVRDTTDMSYQVFIFNNKIPLWLKYMMTNYDILPRPAGVGSKIIERDIRRFGFGADKPFDKPRYSLFNFRANFNKAIFFDNENGYFPDYEPDGSKGKTITQEQYDKRLKWFNLNISAFYNSNFYLD
ncbi:MAG: DUF2612 domain-containing protein [Campylobacter sp.]|nr:DUF2612 domain-containing protein [Campylobacter sp.]